MIDIPDLAAPPQEEQLMGHASAGLSTKSRRSSSRAAKNRRSPLQGPLRALRLCLLCVVVPATLVSVPLYLRYHVYNRQEYPASVSDMRMINSHVSTTWCQTQVVRANATFNAYVVSGTPGVVAEPQRVSMSRQLVLEDDMKEYWAFYLLKGSTVTVSTCVRWQGASLIIIKGHKHLRECAYIGDDSSEEEDELLEELREAEAREAAGQTNSAPSDDTNTPLLMRRAGPGVLLHRLQNPLSSKEQLSKDYSDDTSEEQDTILARMLLRKATDQARVKALNKHAYTSGTNVNTPITKYVHNVDLASATKKSKTPPTSEEVFEEVLKSLKLLGSRGKAVLHKLNDQLGENGDKELHEKIRGLLEEGVVGNRRMANESTTSEVVSGVLSKDKELSLEKAPKKESEDSKKMEDTKDDKKSETTSGGSTTKDVEGKGSGNKIEGGDRGSGSQYKTEGDERSAGSENKTGGNEGVYGNENKTEGPNNEYKTEEEKRNAKRRRREITFGGSKLLELFNKHDIDDDTAIEEDLEPDGIADHHRTLNQTTKGDHSNSEFWSSFSSSEEALLQCAGLVLNLPLTPHRRCEKHRTAEDHATASLPNTVTYKVSSTGYYFFVFSSENEIQPNYFRVHFHLEKTMYNVSNAVAECKNSTTDCALPLGFWSYDTVVLELPVGPDESSWSEDFVVTSTCVPRTAVYLVCILSVPLIILMCALQ